MGKLKETAADLMFPAKMRPYWTFTTATAVALLACVVSALVRVFVRFPPERLAKWESGTLLHSPLLLGLYYFVATIVLWIVYTTRTRAGWYVWRVWVYCMVLTGALIGLLNLVLPLRAF